MVALDQLFFTQCSSLLSALQGPSYGCTILKELQFIIIYYIWLCVRENT